MVTDDKATTPVLSLKNVSKLFLGDKPALEQVSLSLWPGEIHALVGQNGSGKSTLIKILAGYHAPEPGGLLEVRGQRVDLPLAPGQFRALGMSFVHQNLGLSESMTVLDNLRVGRYTTGFGWRIRLRHESQLVNDALGRFGVDISPETLVLELSQGNRAVLAVARALQEIEGHQRGVLILDEPTPYLGRDAVNRLFDAMRKAASQGAAILFVSHRLEEVFQIADRVSILRDGRLIGTTRSADITEADLVEMIIGRRLQDLYPTRLQSVSERVLRVRGLQGGRVKNFAIDLHAGEIVGLTGLVGMGFEDIPYLLMGAQRAAKGVMVIGDRTHPVSRPSIRDRLGLGMVLVPEKRERDGAAMSLTVTENVSLPRISEYFRAFFLDHRRERADALDLMHLFDVRPPESNRVFATLSGGNQQKAVLGKWLVGQPRILLLHEPTQGVDVGARQEIFRQIKEATGKGAGVIIASIEYEDLSHLCHRVLVFQDGSVTSELADANLTKDRIVEHSYRSLGEGTSPERGRR